VAHRLYADAPVLRGPVADRDVLIAAFPGLVAAGGARGRRAPPGRRGLGGAVQVEPAREQPACWVADVGSPGPMLRVCGCRNGTIVSYISGLISVRYLFCQGRSTTATSAS
jgi:hypothetical protein